MPQVSTLPLAVPSLWIIGSVTTACAAALARPAPIKAVRRLACMVSPRKSGLRGARAMRVSEEAERLRRVAHQQVLGLLVMVEHHLVRLAADARFLVAAEGGVRR